MMQVACSEAPGQIETYVIVLDSLGTDEIYGDLEYRDDESVVDGWVTYVDEENNDEAGGAEETVVGVAGTKNDDDVS